MNQSQDGSIQQILVKKNKDTTFLGPGNPLNSAVPGREPNTLCNALADMPDLEMGGTVLESSDPIEALQEQLREERILRQNAEAEAREAENDYWLVVEKMNEGLGIIDENYFILYVNQKLVNMTGFGREEVIGKKLDDFFSGRDLTKIKRQVSLRKEGKEKPYELVLPTKSGGKISTIVSPMPRFDEQGKYRGSFGLILDITRLKEGEKSLKKKENDLLAKDFDIEKSNAALKTLIKKRDEDRKELEDRIFFNIRHLVQPCVEKFEKSGLTPTQQTFLESLKETLQEIITPSFQHLNEKYYQLTPTEIQVANAIKQGKSTQEIATLLSNSHRTIETHRNNIRKKLGLKKKKANLRTFLHSLR